MGRLSFSPPMVRALLDGRKTMTRRILGTRGRNNIFAHGEWADDYVLDPGNAAWRAHDTPYAVGDRLWVREAWRLPDDHDGDSPTAFVASLSDLEPGPNGLVRFEADGCDAWGDSYSLRLPVGRLRAAMHLPRMLSRLTLLVTDVRVQRLQDISEDDILAEGVDPLDSDLVAYRGEYSGGHCVVSEELRSRRRSFAAVWERLHGAGAWGANPWVAAITFECRHANIDAPPLPPPSASEHEKARA